MPKVCRQSRRLFLQQALSGFATLVLARHLEANPVSSGSPVAIARCRRYEFDPVKSTLARLFDQIGGVQSLVKGKTLTVKVNLTGNWTTKTYTLPPMETVFTHPIVVLAACSLFSGYGARRIIICDSSYQIAEARVVFQNLGYDVSLFESMIPGLLWEDTRNMGSGESYKTIQTGSRAYIYSSFEVNHCYVDTDVMVSMAKMKNHQIAGITLSMKNLFGITPSALYSSAIHNENSTEARTQVLHEGGGSAAGGEILPVSSHEPGFRVPRVVVDILKARPVDLSIIDGIVSVHGGEGQWQGPALGVVVPGLLIAGRNPVCTDSVTAAVMGYDPGAPDWTSPFQNGANMLRLGEEAGLGTNRLSEIEVVGLGIGSARNAFLPVIRQ